LIVRKRVLIAEDETSIIEALSFILTRENFDVTVEMDGKKALDQITANQPDVMILDIMLPGMNGIEILKHIRTDRSLDSLPVIMLTAKGQSQDRHLAMEIGANLFITKPFDNQDVVDAVHKLTSE
jgi:DNA-binding response OmpR family regulator